MADANKILPPSPTPTTTTTTNTATKINASSTNLSSILNNNENPNLNEKPKKNLTKKRKNKVKLLQYLKDNGFASSNKIAKKLIRDNRVFVNGSSASSCSLMVSCNIEGHVKVMAVVRDNDMVENRNSIIGSGEIFSNVKNSHNQQQQNQQQEDSSLSMPMATSITSNSTSTSESMIHMNDSKPFCIAYHKPCGMICTTAKDSTKKQHYMQEGQYQTLADIVQIIPDGFHPIGRLDRHSHGLLLFSTDGRLTSALLSPKSCIPRVYEIIVRGDVGIENEDRYQDIKRKVTNGVQTDYGFFEGNILSMKRDVGKDGYAHQKCNDDSGAKRHDRYGMSPEEYAKSNKTSSCHSSDGIGITTGICCDDDGEDDNENEDITNNKNEVLSLIRVAVKEGKKRMVRRLFAALDLFVLGEFICFSFFILRLFLHFHFICLGLINILKIV